MIEPASEEFLADRYAVYDTVRSQSPIYYHEDWNLTLLSRHADVHAALRDRRLGRDIIAAIGEESAANHREIPSAFPMWTHYVRRMAFMDREGDIHKRLRDSVAKAFTKKRVDRLGVDIAHHARQLLEQAGDSFDAITGYATPIPLAVIGSLLGVPQPDQFRLVDWSHRIVTLYDPTVGAEQGESAETATEEFVAYLTDLIAERRRTPSDDLLTDLLDELSQDELIGTCILVLNAGHEATVHAIGNAIAAIAGDPVVHNRIAGGDVNWKLAVDELLRFDTPLHMFERWVTEPMQIGGVTVSPGQKVGLLMGAANRDPDRFDQPNSLNIDRADNPHVSFGGGAHFCVGAALARVELTIALRTLFDRHPGLSVGEADRHDSFIFRGFSRMTIEA